MAKEKLRLVPVTGKFCQVTLAERKYQIWKVLPGSGPKDPKGTPIDYDVAVQLLCLQPPVVSLVPKIEGGKFVAQLSDKDLVNIKEAQLTGQSQISNAFLNPQDPAKTAPAGDNSALVAAQKEQIETLKELVESQKAQIDEQNKQSQQLSAQVAELTKQFAAINKK